MMLAGLRSRWVMPRWCAAPTASASGIAEVSTRSSGKPPSGIRSASVWPSTSSSVRNGTRRSSSTEWMVTMLGWLSAAAARASRSNRSRRSGSAQLAGEYLERDSPPQSRVVGEVHLAHSAFPEQFHDLVVPEGGANHALVAPDGMRRNYTVGLVAGRLLDADDHRVRPDERLDARRGKPASFIQPEQSAPV